MRWRGFGWWWLLAMVGALCGSSSAQARWGRAQLLYRTDLNLRSVALAENARGDAVAAWVVGGVLHLTVARTDRPFAAAKVIHGPRVIAERGVGAAIDDRGRAVVAAFDGADAESGGTPSRGVVVVRGSVGGRWSGPETVSLPGEQPTSGDGNGGPIVAIRGGRSVVGWDAVGSGSGNTRVRVVQAGWGRPFGLPVEPARSPDSAILGLIVTGAGAAETVWAQQTAAGAQAFVASAQHGRFGTPAPILATLPRGDFTVAQGFAPIVGLDALGGVRLLWGSSVALYRPGGPPVPLVALGESTSALAVSRDGHALAVSGESNTNLSGLPPPTRLVIESARPGRPFGAPHRTRGPSCGMGGPSLALGVSDTGRGALVGACDNLDQVGNQPPTGPAVVAIPIDAHGRPGAEHVLLKAGGGELALVAVDGRGHATAFWLAGAGFHAARQYG